MGTPLRATCRPEQENRPHLAVVGEPLRAEELQPDPQEEGLDQSQHHRPLHNWPMGRSLLFPVSG